MEKLKEIILALWHKSPVLAIIVFAVYAFVAFLFLVGAVGCTSSLFIHKHSAGATISTEQTVTADSTNVTLNNSVQ